jgi:hypothetical protein
MTIAIRSGGMAIGKGTDGTPTWSLTPHVLFDVCPTWTELALRHLEDSRSKRTTRQAAWNGTNDDEKAATLEREFEASMQAIMAAAIAIDAFYSLIQTHIQLPEALIAKWRDKRTPRYSQVTEVLRRAFNLKPKDTATLRQNLKEIYRLRDLAVHPSGRLEVPILHPEINVGVEWRFAYFRADNAELIVYAATGILWELVHGGKPKDGKIQKYMASLLPRLAQLFPTGHPMAETPISST